MGSSCKGKMGLDGDAFEMHIRYLVVGVCGLGVSLGRLPGGLRAFEGCWLPLQSCVLQSWPVSCGESGAEMGLGNLQGGL